MKLPTRIQRSRAKGATTPTNTKYCGRPGKWGNPFRAVKTMKNPDRFVVFVITPLRALRDLCESIKYRFGPAVFSEKHKAQAHAAFLFGKLMDNSPGLYPVHELAQYTHLSCWCAIDSPCHVDEIINRIKNQQP